MIRRLLSHLFGPLLDWIVSSLPVDDSWKRIAVRPRPAHFGKGSHRAFPWYFEGDSLVKIDSIDALCDWLRACEYVQDMALFNEPDFWQHPRTFEQLRRGDCEDHALWAWRKLAELGVAAEFVKGRYGDTPEDAGLHAWVLFRDAAGMEFILESVSKEDDVMVIPVSEARAYYVPHFAVDHSFRTVAFAGYILEVRRRRRQQAEQRG